MEQTLSLADLRVKPLSQKAINSIANTAYLNVWEGAVRSSKTVASSLAWIIYVANSNENYFIMSGKTIATLYRNVIAGDFGMLAMLGPNGEYKTDREGNRILLIKGEKGIKTCYCFGAHDESSFQTMRGITAGGWYADEINLQPRSFVEEAFRRTIVSTDRKNFWTLNPDNPNHWIYLDYLDKYEEQELPGFYLWHFGLEDNLAITEARREELKAQFSGIFYDRYILGKRVAAEGAVYNMFTPSILYEDWERPEGLATNSIRKIAADYGTANPFHALDIYDDGTVCWVDREYRWDSKSDEAMRSGIGQKTDAQYGDDIVNFMNNGLDYHLCPVILDPSAASMAAELRTRFIPLEEAKNDVSNGIQVVSNCFDRKIVRINKKCKHLIRELNGYVWDEKALLKGIERPLKIEDHGPDALRYYCYTHLPNWRTGFNLDRDAA